MGTSIYPLPRADREAVQNKLLYITHSKYENDWPSQPHIHPFAELFYVKDGSGSFLFEEEEYSIEKDDFVIVNAGISHTEISSAAMPLEYVSIGMEGCSFSYQGNKDCILFKCGDDQNGLLFLMTAMLNEMEERNRDCEIVCQNLLEILIIKLVRRINFAFEEAPHIQINKECIKIKRYIEANYTQNITLDSLAEFSHLNKYYMAHAFTLHCGCSPIRYLCETRIKASKGMLANTDYSITEVARYCGFSSQSYFTRMFRLYTGETPKKFREKYMQSGL